MKSDFDRTTGRAGDDAGPPAAPAKYPVLTLDVSLYEEFLAGSNMTDDQKREFIEALWIIVVGFVDLGFGIHPVQQALQAGASEPLDENSGTDADRLLAIQRNTQKEEAHALLVGTTGGAATKEEQ